MAKQIEISSHVWECAYCGKQYESEKRALQCEAAFERAMQFKAMFIPDQLNWYQYRTDNIYTSNFGADKDQDILWVLGYEMQERKHYENDYPYAPDSSCMRTYNTIYNANVGHHAIDYLHQPLRRIPLMDGFIHHGLFPDMKYIKRTYKHLTNNQKSQIKEFWLEVQKFVDKQVQEFTCEQLKNLCTSCILRSYIKPTENNKTVELPNIFWENAMRWTFQLPED